MMHKQCWWKVYRTRRAPLGKNEAGGYLGAAVNYKDANGVCYQYATYLATPSHRDDNEAAQVDFGGGDNVRAGNPAKAAKNFSAIDRSPVIKQQPRKPRGRLCSLPPRETDRSRSEGLEYLEGKHDDRREIFKSKGAAYYPKPSGDLARLSGKAAPLTKLTKRRSPHKSFH